MLSRTSLYALRALVVLARHRGEPAILGRQIAAEVDVPSNYLTKVLCALAKAGFLRSTRGIGGGFRLVRPPDRIILREVVEVFDRIEGRDACLLGQGKCGRGGGCSAHARWKTVWEGYLKFLDETSLANISGGVSSPGPALAAGLPRGRRPLP